MKTELEKMSEQINSVIYKIKLTTLRAAPPASCLVRIVPPISDTRQLISELRYYVGHLDKIANDFDPNATQS